MQIFELRKLKYNVKSESNLIFSFVAVGGNHIFGFTDLGKELTVVYLALT